MKRIKPRLPESGARLKVPANLSEPPDDKQPPLFCFRYLRRGYSIPDCTSEEKAALADRLHKMTQLSWLELRLAPRSGLGSEKISHSAIKEEIPGHITEDVTLLAFRFCGNAPMVGYRTGRIFHAVWLDRAFTLYDHGS